MSIDAESGDPASATVDRLSEDLGDAIAELPAYQTFLEARRAVENDEQAQEKIRTFERLRNEYLQAKQAGTASEEDLRRLHTAQDDLHDLPVMAEYLQAQSHLERRLQKCNALISDPLAIDFSDRAGECCQD
jgi:cell fate (sporulation/competence/biofilm development) regulator YlbF (YheA/YmcA/DUF963 family)